MSTTLAMKDGFNADLTGILPRLRAYALSLTHNRDRADDLVQQTALKALAGRKSFRLGTNFGGWIFRIQRNEFISELRRERPTVNLDDAVASLPFRPPQQDNGLIMREFMAAFRQLSDGTRRALLLTQLEGYSHEQVASHVGIAVGTVKSRISRGRDKLECLLARPNGSLVGARAQANQVATASQNRVRQPLRWPAIKPITPGGADVQARVEDVQEASSSPR